MMAKNGAPSLASLYNVDLYSGTASANIPIYSYSVNNLDLSVSLGYSMNGIRVDDRSGPCGTGWNLAANGYIVREVHGIEDEVAIPSNYTANDTDYSIGAWVANSNINNHQEKEHDLFTAVFGGRTIRFQMDNPSTQAYSLKTYPNSGIRIKTVVEHSNVLSGPNNGGEQVLSFWSDIEPRFRKIGANENQNILKFYLYDEYGNTFVFTRGEYEWKTVKDGQNNDFTYYPTTRWNLTQVWTATGLVVNYTYTLQDMAYDAYKSEKIKEVYQWTHLGEPPGIFPEENKVVVWKGKASRLDKIEYPNGVTVDFTYRTEFDQHIEMVNPLDKIRITGKYDNQVKHSTGFDFSYSFFQSPWKNYNLPATRAYTDYNTLLYSYYNSAAPGASLTEVLEHMRNGLRLKLDKIITVSEDGQNNYDAYTFSYNSTPLPGRLDPGRDYYGYANGKTPVQPQEGFLQNLSIPLHAYMNGLTTYGVDKTPDFNYTKSCLLNEIQTAAGGNITFLFKEHQLYNPAAGYRGLTNGLSNPPIVYPAYEGADANDGACIDEVVLTDGFNNDNTTRTRYAFAGGQRFMRGGFSWYEYDQFIAASEAKMYTNNFVAPMPFVNGANHGYTYAEVKNYGFNNQFLGSTKYHYTNLLLESDSTQSTLQMRLDSWANTCPIVTFYQYRMGHPLDITSYDQNGTAIKQVQYTYADSVNSTRAYLYNPTGNDVGFRNGYIRYYNFHAIPFLQKNKTETTYTNNGTFVKSVDYTFDTKDHVKTSTWLDEFGQENTKTYYYDYEYSDGHGLYLPKRTVLTRKINGTDYLVDMNTTDYDYPQVRYRQSSRLINEGMEVPQMDLIWSHLNPDGTYDLKGALGSPNVKLQEQITAYDSKSNPVEVKHEDKERYTATIWDTRIGQKAAVADNARYSEIAYTSFEGTFQPRGTVDDNKGNWEFSPAQIVYIAPSSSTQPMTGHYYYQLDGSGIDSKNTLTQAKKYIITFWANGTPSISGATVDVGATGHLQKGSWTFYSAEVTGTGNTLHITGNGIVMDELRLYPANASMVTTTYEPLFGPNSNADASGNINYYEYDGLGRQTVVRDIDRNVLSVTQQVLHGADVY